MPVDPPPSLVDALAHSAFTVMGVLTRVAALHELSLTQLRVLAILRDRDALRMSTLAHYLGLDRSTLTGLVDRAADRDLLRRRRDPSDGRAFVVELTPAGLGLADRVSRELRELLHKSLSPLTASEQTRLQDLLFRSVALDPDR